MRTFQTFQFDGAMRTIAEIRAIVPCLGVSTIKAHLAAGRNTKQAMLTHDSSRGRASKSRSNGAKLRAQSWKQAGMVR
jgi:hypothetical protein